MSSVLEKAPRPAFALHFAHSAATAGGWRTPAVATAAGASSSSMAGASDGPTNDSASGERNGRLVRDAIEGGTSGAATRFRTAFETAEEEPESVRVEVCRLWADNLRLERPADEKFRWQYRLAPHPARSIHVIRWQDEAGARHTVGTGGVSERRYHLAGQDVRVGVVGDVAVDREHRGLLPALRLLRAVRESIDADLDVAYGFPNAKADGVMLRAGFHRLGKARRYARVLRHAGYVGRLAERLPKLPPLLVPLTARVLATPIVAAAGGAVIDAARLVGVAPGAARAAAHHRLAWADHFDQRFDALWMAARSAYPMIGERTSAFLGWRYPVCDIATLTRRGDGALRAYAIVEIHPSTRAAHLHDVFGHPGDLAALFDLLLPALYLRGAASVSVRFLGAPRVAELLAARGFEPRDEGRTVVVEVGPRRAEHRALLLDPASWHLFDEDEDV
jgi:hypothetical protein